MDPRSWVPTHLRPIRAILAVESMKVVRDLPLQTGYPVLSPEYDLDAYIVALIGGEAWDFCWVLGHFFVDWSPIEWTQGNFIKHSSPPMALRRANPHGVPSPTRVTESQTCEPQDTIKIWWNINKGRSWLYHAKKFVGLVLRVGSSFLLTQFSTQVTGHLQKVLPCRYPCHTWGLGFGTPCDPALSYWSVLDGSCISSTPNTPLEILGDFVLVHKKLDPTLNTSPKIFSPA